MPAESNAEVVDARWMRSALREAAKGIGRTSPNPAVGAVIVRRGRVIGRGFHHAAGQPHAEIEALRSLKRPDAACGATMYVTLEPCSTQGRTGPCTEAIKAAGLSRVVVGATDPNPVHAGRGLDILKAAGIEVRSGVLAHECRKLNRPFNHWIVTGQPWVIAKAALSLDGRLTRSPGEGQWLSGARARARVHRLRARVDAILIGAGTLRTDNPRLTVRSVPDAAPGRQPWRVVLAGARSELPEASHVFTDEWKDRTLVYRDRTMTDVLADLGLKGVTSVLIEGGGKVLGQAFDSGLVDEVEFYLTPWITGSPHTAVAGTGLMAQCNGSFEQLGRDVVFAGEVVRQ